MLKNFRNNIHQLFSSEEVNEVYLTQALRAFSFALIGIYVPMHLYELGFSLKLIGILFALFGFVRAAFTPVTAWLVSLYGPKHVMSLSQILSIGFLLLLTLVDTHNWVAVPALLVWGISSAFFWLSNHYNLSFVRQNDQTSQEVGIIYILLTLARALGPLIGGVIATQIDFSYTLLLAVVFLMGASYVITKTPEQAPLPNFNLKRDMFKGWKNIYGDVIANFTGMIQGVAGKKLWPFYIFIFLGTFQTVGLVKSISIIGSIVILYIVGKRGDDGKNDQQLRLGSRWSSFIHALRPFAQTFSIASIIDLASQFTSKIYKVPFLSYYYENSSRNQSRIGYVTKMEISAGLGQMTAWLLLTGIVTLLSTLTTLTVMFYIAAIAVLFKTWIIPENQR